MDVVVQDREPGQIYPQPNIESLEPRKINVSEK